MKKYDEYKSSGDDWFGEIPMHWNADRLKGYAIMLTGFPFKSEHYSETGIKLARGINVKEGAFNWSDTKYWNSLTKNLIPFYLKKDDILIGMDGSKIGKNYCLVKDEDLPILLLQRVARLRVKKKLNSKFLFYLIGNISFLYWITITKTDPMVPHIAPMDINNYPIPLPSIEEQKSIASYLDAKTSAIDKKLSLLQTKTAYYKELSKALINEAVCRGLDKNAPLKESGIEWIGKIPEHWKTKRLKDIAKNIGSGATPLTNKSQYYDNGILNWVNTGDLNDGIINDCQYKISEEAIKDYPNLKLNKKGTLLIAMYGATICKIGLLNIEATTNQACCCINFKKKHFSKFIFYWFLANKITSSV